MRSGGRQVGVTLATKDPKMIIRRQLCEKCKVRRRELESLGRQYVEEDSGSGEGLHPIGGRHGRLKEQ